MPHHRVCAASHYSQWWEEEGACNCVVADDQTFFFYFSFILLFCSFLILSHSLVCFVYLPFIFRQNKSGKSEEEKKNYSTLFLRVYRQRQQWIAEGKKAMNKKRKHEIIKKRENMKRTYGLRVRNVYMRCILRCFCFACFTVLKSFTHANNPRHSFDLTSTKTFLTNAKMKNNKFTKLWDGRTVEREHKKWRWIIKWWETKQQSTKDNARVSIEYSLIFWLRFDCNWFVIVNIKMRLRIHHRRRWIQNDIAQSISM